MHVIDVHWMLTCEVVSNSGLSNLFATRFQIPRPSGWLTSRCKLGNKDRLLPLWADDRESRLCVVATIVAMAWTRCRYSLLALLSYDKTVERRESWTRSPSSFSLTDTRAITTAPSIGKTPLA